MAHRAIIAGLVVLLGTTGVLHSAGYEGRIDVLEVRVPVNVVDREGNAVRGLTASDFVVREGRRKREIAGFRVIDLEALDPTPGRIDLSQVLPAEGRRHFLLVFDMTFSRPASVLQAREAARQFILSSLHPTDLAAIMTFSEQAGLRLLVTFTSDRAQLARAIDSLGRNDLLAQGPNDPLRFLIDTPASQSEPAQGAISDTRAATSAVGAAREAMDLTEEVVMREVDRQQRSYERGRIESWVRTLGLLGEALEKVAGRKQVVYFSEGFDEDLLMGQNASDRMADASLSSRVGHHLPTESQATYGDLSLLTEITRVLGRFEENGSSIHSVDISGVGGPEGGGFLHATLSGETGGEVVENTNRLGEALDAILDGSRVTYLLTIRADEVRPDGSYHRIRVEVPSAPDATVLYRPGFHAPEPFEELHPLEKSLLAADALASVDPRSELEIDLLVAPFRASAGRAYVPVIVEIGGDSLLEGHERELLPLELYAYASDSQGRILDFFTQLLTLDARSARKQLPGSGIKYYGHLDLPSGEYLVRVMARNGVTGRTAVEAARLAVPGFAGEEPALVGAFAREPPGTWLLVREQRDGQEARVVYPFTVKGEIFVPAARPRLASDDSRSLCLVAYGLGEGRIEVRGEIVDDDGEALRQADLRLEERTVTGIDGYDKFLVSFRPPDLEPGDYVLRITLREETSSLVPATSMKFRIGS